MVRKNHPIPSPEEAASVTAGSRTHVLLEASHSDTGWRCTTHPCSAHYPVNNWPEQSCNMGRGAVLSPDLSEAQAWPPWGTCPWLTASRSTLAEEAAALPLSCRYLFLLLGRWAWARAGTTNVVIPDGTGGDTSNRSENQEGENTLLLHRT